MGTSYTRSSGQVIDNQDVNPNMDNDTWNISRRYAGLSAIWNNPNAGDTGCARQQTYSTAQRVRKFTNVANRPFSDPGFGFTVPAPNAGNNIRAYDFETAKTVINTGVDLINNLTGSAISRSGGFAASGQTISASHINNMVQTITALESRLDAYNSYYDGADLCQRSCQIACQTACQTSCQGCNTSQCHNQKCGIH